MLSVRCDKQNHFNFRRRAVSHRPETWSGAKCWSWAWTYPTGDSSLSACGCPCSVRTPSQSWAFLLCRRSGESGVPCFLAECFCHQRVAFPVLQHFCSLVWPILPPPFASQFRRPPACHCPGNREAGCVHRHADSASAWGWGWPTCPSSAGKPSPPSVRFAAGGDEMALPFPGAGTVPNLCVAAAAVRPCCGPVGFHNAGSAEPRHGAFDRES